MTVLDLSSFSGSDQDHPQASQDTEIDGQFS